MSVIYEPSGKAREYSPRALNIYTGCDHGCKYCYAPGIRRMNRDQFLNVSQRANIVNNFQREAKKNYGLKHQILFSFMGDPYCEANDRYQLTRDCLEIALENKIPVAVLTKGGSRCLQDLDLFRQFGPHFKLGQTLTFFDYDKSKAWEPGAASPKERLETLKNLHEQGINTWASFEPVIEPEESLKLLKASLPYVDEYKVGKLNNFQGLDKKVDWTKFLTDVVDILRPANKKFYIKHDLAAAAPTVKLTSGERDADSFCLGPFNI